MSEKINILIVDDEPKTREKLKKLIQLERDYNIILAQSGNTAIKIISDGIEKVDLLITDMYMPDGTGLELITHISQNDLNIKVILISGGSRTTGEDDLEKDHLINSAKKYGKATFIKKPFKSDEVLEKIDELMIEN